MTIKKTIALAKAGLKRNSFTVGELEKTPVIRLKQVMDVLDKIQKEASKK